MTNVKLIHLIYWHYIPNNSLKDFITNMYAQGNRKEDSKQTLKTINNNIEGKSHQQ